MNAVGVTPDWALKVMLLWTCATRSIKLLNLSVSPSPRLLHGDQPIHQLSYISAALLSSDTQFRIIGNMVSVVWLSLCCAPCPAIYMPESRLNQSVHKNILSISGLFLIGYGHASCDTETFVKLTTYIICHKPDKINGSQYTEDAAWYMHREQCRKLAKERGTHPRNHRVRYAQNASVFHISFQNVRWEALVYFCTGQNVPILKWFITIDWLTYFYSKVLNCKIVTN